MKFTLMFLWFKIILFVKYILFYFIQINPNVFCFSTITKNKLILCLDAMINWRMDFRSQCNTQMWIISFLFFLSVFLFEWFQRNFNGMFLQMLAVDWPITTSLSNCTYWATNCFILHKRSPLYFISLTRWSWISKFIVQ